MAIGENFQRLHMSLSIGASVVAILSVLVAIVAYFKTDALQKLFDETRHLELRLSIASPTNGSEQKGSVVPWTGKVEMRVQSGDQNTLNTTLELAERRIQIIPFVRSLSVENLWWEQTAASVDASGTLTGSLNLGEPDGRGVGQSYQVVLLSIMADVVKQGRTFADLPPHSSASPVITVRRME